MKSARISLAAISIVLMAGLASAESSNWNNLEPAALLTNSTKTEGTSRDGKIDSANNTFVLPEIFRKAQRPQTNSAQVTSDFEALLSAFQKGKRPFKDDLLGYKAGWYVTSSKPSDPGGIIMFGFYAMPGNTAEGLPLEGTYTKILYCANGIFDNPTPEGWAEINKMLNSSGSHGPTTFTGNLAFNTDDLDIEFRSVWKFRVFEGYLLFTRSTETQGIIGAGYFYKKIQAPNQSK